MAIAEFHFSRGDLLMGVANIVFAFNHVMVRKYSAQMSSNTLTAYSTLICFACFTVLMMFTSPVSFNLSMNYWISALGIGILGTSVAFLLWNSAVYDVGAPKASIFINFVPISTAIFSVILGEALQFYHFESAVAVISGLAVMNLRELKHAFVS